jgi:hypothetical protein
MNKDNELNASANAIFEVLSCDDFVNFDTTKPLGTDVNVVSKTNFKSICYLLSKSHALIDIIVYIAKINNIQKFMIKRNDNYGSLEIQHGNLRIPFFYVDVHKTTFN